MLKKTLIKRRPLPLGLLLDFMTRRTSLVGILCFALAIPAYADPDYQHFKCESGWTNAANGPGGRPLFSISGTELQKNLATIDISQGCSDESEPGTKTCYSNASTQLLQTHIFVTERIKKEKELGRLLTKQETDELKEELKIMPLYVWLKGNKNHRGKIYLGNAPDHLQALRGDLSLMKEPHIKGLDLKAGAYLASQFEGYDPFEEKAGRNPYQNCPSFESCCNQSKKWFSEKNVLGATAANSARAFFDIMGSFLTDHADLKMPVNDFNVYSYSADDQKTSLIPITS
jgi:hypothetical protein